MRRALGCTLALAALLCGAPLRAADLAPLSRWTHQGWSTEDGLPQVSVNAMARERSGLLWAGTESGLARFDGSEFEDFGSALRALTGTTWVTALLRDAEDRIWIGTLQGVVVATQGRLSAVAVDGGAHPGKVHALATDPSGRVCVAAERLWCTQGDRLVPQTAWEGAATALAGAADGMWVAGDGHLLRLPLQGDASVRSFPAAFGTQRVNALAHDGQRLWLGGTAGLWVLEPGATQPVPATVDGAAPGTVRALAAGADGTLWVSTHDEVLRLDGPRLIERLQGRALQGLGTVISLLAEADGSVWMGSQANGLMHFWHGDVEQLGLADGLGNTSVWTYLAGEGGLLVGTDDGVWRFDGARFARLIEGAALPNPVAYSLMWDRRGGLYVGTRGGLARFDGDLHGQQVFPALDTLQVNSLVEEPDGTVWVASHGGLFRIRDGAARRVAADGELEHARVRSLLRDREGVLWAGTEGGLFRREGESFRRVAEPGPSRAFVMTLLELGDGRLLAGSYENGLYVRDADGWWHLGADAGLPADTLFFLDEYQGQLIASHPNGAYRVPLQTLQRTTPLPLGIEVLVQDLGQQPGRTRLRCCNGGGTARGTVDGAQAWLPTLGGALRVRLDTGLPAPPVTRLRGARQGERVLGIASGAVRLAEGARDLTLEYGAVDFRDTARLRYRYRLDGFDAGWVDAERRRQAFYTNLPAGEYRFAVQAKRRFDAWGPVQELSIRVPPRLTETWPFRIGMLLLLLLAGTALLRLRESRARVQRARLEDIVSQRTRELSAANERLAALNEALAAASVTDPLTGLHNRRFIHEQIGSVVATLRRNRARTGEDRVIGICVADIDHFKRVNDDYGHATGDRVLKRVASALRREMRDGDYLLRWGGEEFVVITNESLRGDLPPIVERMRTAVEGSTAAPGEPARVTVSVGYAAYPLPDSELDGHDWLSAMNLADQALYGAKNAGRNCIATVQLTENALSTAGEHLSAAQLAAMYADGRARLQVGAAPEPPAA
jgi:diguanylate cyclase (GGDEF)-like protein